MHRSVVNVRGNSLDFDASIIGGNSLGFLFVTNPVYAVQSVFYPLLPWYHNQRTLGIGLHANTLDPSDRFFHSNSRKIWIR